MPQLKQAIVKAFSTEFDHTVSVEEIKIENTNPQFEGSFTFVVFPYLRVTRKKPEESAEIIGNAVVQELTEIKDFNVVKGFLNFSLKDAYWVEYLESLTQAKRLGTTADKPQKVMVEYSSPNTNKPLHLGHVRNNLLGFSIAEILEYYGHEVIKVNLINDRGIHICKSMLAYQKFANGETPESSGIKGDHLVGKYYVEFDIAHKKELAELVASGMSEDEAKASSTLMNEAREMLGKWEKGDEETLALWNKLNNWVYKGFDASYSRMGVSFEKFYKESETYLLGKKMVMDGLEAGILFQKEDGSIWADLTDDGLDQKLLLRADGTSVYMTQDLGTADLKYADYGMDTSIYVVGNEQDYHFKVLRLILEKLGKTYASGVFHMSYGMVELPEGKMKTREGKVVDADDLMDEMYETAKLRTMEQGKTDGLSDDELHGLYETLGLGALKYFLLKVDPTKRIVFNPSETIDFQGNTGTFIQYTYARCKSVLRNWSDSLTFDTSLELEPTERDLIAHLFGFDAKLEEACKLYSPSIIAQYLYDTAKFYNSFYNQCSILKAENQSLIQFRVGLTAVTVRMLETCGKLLGMQMPEKM
ncbi:MAG: arginine--tRNA ligase [Bacteroidia bacterium]|nr:arginine--tRNA ligase [Bacteroidia bacterium]